MENYCLTTCKTCPLAILKPTADGEKQILFLLGPTAPLQPGKITCSLPWRPQATFYQR